MRRIECDLWSDGTSKEQKRPKPKEIKTAVDSSSSCYCTGDTLLRFLELYQPYRVELVIVTREYYKGSLTSQQSWRCIHVIFWLNDPTMGRVITKYGYQNTASHSDVRPVCLKCLRRKIRWAHYGKRPHQKWSNVAEALSEISTVEGNRKKWKVIIFMSLLQRNQHPELMQLFIWLILKFRKFHFIFLGPSYWKHSVQ